MKVAYVAYEDSNNVKAWSGTIYYMAKYLSKENEVIKIDNLLRPIDYFYKLLSSIIRFFGYSSDYKRNISYIKFVCKRIQKRLDKIDYDIIFAPGVVYITYIKSNKPIVCWADATFINLMDSYPQYSNMPKIQISNGDKIERLAFKNSTKLIFSTVWAAKSAIEDYNIDKSKIEVVPLGANLNHINTETDIIKFNLNKSKENINLLFIGVDWYKKGGDLLLDIFRELRKLSSKYNLNVVGSTPNEKIAIDGVTFHGFLNKAIAEENLKLINLFQTSHYFLLPTRAEAFGIVFCEANSYGLPVFGSDLGGIPDIVKDGINGELIDIKKTPKELAMQIHNYISNGEYVEKSLMAFNHYIDNFTWDCSIDKVNKILKNLV